MKRNRKSARLGLFIEPELRTIIENEARRCGDKLSEVIRTALRRQFQPQASQADRGTAP